MNATIVIKDAETGETLQEIGELTYDSAGRAIQNCNQWYANEIETWADRNYQPEIVLIDHK